MQRRMGWEHAEWQSRMGWEQAECVGRHDIVRPEPSTQLVGHGTGHDRRRQVLLPGCKLLQDPARMYVQYIHAVIDRGVTHFGYVPTGLRERSMSTTVTALSPPAVSSVHSASCGFQTFWKHPLHPLHRIGMGWTRTWLCIPPEQAWTITHKLYACIHKT